jgi:hypothetical protein
MKRDNKKTNEALSLSIEFPAKYKKKLKPTEKTRLQTHLEKASKILGAKIKIEEK